MVKSFCGSTACRFVFFLYFCGMIGCNKKHPFQQDTFRRLHRPIVWALLFCFLAFTSCSPRSHHEETFGRVNRLKYVRPDSALALLDSMKAGGQRLSHHDEMLWQLQRMDVENKLDTLFHTTADAQRLADYFDRHGSANEQMLAHYLLGRAYADTHEAPMALGCYMDAIEKADTTREDCDFKLLGRVCIQAGEVLDLKRQIPERLSFVHKAIDYSNRSGDSLTVVYLYGMIGEAYERMNKADSAIVMFEYMADRYRQLGRSDLAAGWLGYCARLHIEKGEFTKAAEHMQIYERESGFFHENGEIEAGREPYYGMKGRYYLNVGKLDSAEYFYRLELKRGRDFNNQSIGSRGLSKVFTEKGMPDSASKYSMYCLQMSDSLYERNVTDKLKRVKDLFDYSRSQRIASEAMEKAHTRLLWLLLYGGISIMVFTYFIYSLYMTKKAKANDILAMRYLIAEVAKMQTEVVLLKQNNQENEDLILEKEEALLCMEEELEKYKAKWKGKIIVPDSVLVSSDIYKNIHALAQIGQTPSEKDWKDLQQFLASVLPEFNEFVCSHIHLMNEKEFRTCLLVRMYVRPASIANMLGVTGAYISKTRTSLLKDLFDVVGKPIEFDKRIQELC